MKGVTMRKVWKEKNGVINTRGSKQLDGDWVNNR